MDYLLTFLGLTIVGPMLYALFLHLRRKWRYRQAMRQWDALQRRIEDRRDARSDH